jgi:hypothetical protein
MVHMTHPHVMQVKCWQWIRRHVEPNKEGLENSGPLLCDDMCFGDWCAWLPTFWRFIAAHLQGPSSAFLFLDCLTLNMKALKSFKTSTSTDPVTESRPRRLESSSALLWELQILQ